MRGSETLAKPFRFSYPKTHYKNIAIIIISAAFPACSSMDVIGFGTLILDRIIYLDKIPQAGQESFLKAFESFPGGSSANTIAALAKLEVSTGFVGKIGSDPEGSLLIESMMYQGVDTKGIKLSEGRSGTCFILVDSSGQRSLITDSGVNDYIEPRDIEMKYFDKAKLLHMCYFTCRESWKSFETQKKLSREMRSMGIKVSFDPGYVYAKMGLDNIRELVRNSNIIMLNEEEIRMLTGLDYIEGSRKLLSMGPECVAVKLGEKGCFVVSSTEEHLVPALKVNALDTTGAGDAFNAGFLFGILKQKSLEECGRLGNAVASFCVQKLGARDGLPTKEELLRMGFNEKMGLFGR